jgi:N-formylglutamate amidohydrolase
MLIQNLPILLSGAVFAVAFASHGQAQMQVDPYLTVRLGRLPIIITAPHGGQAWIPEVAERRPGGPFKAVVVRDANTSELAFAAAAEIERLLGAPPFVIVAHFTRTQIDANRPPEAAFEAATAARAKSVYDAYHGAVADACEAVRRQFGRGLLIDVHGQAGAPGAALRGTNNGDTVRGLIEQHGIEALQGPRGLMGQLAAQGIPVFPPVGSPLPENPRYDGGYTVRTYGRLQGYPIDAIQIEFGGEARRTDRIAQTGRALAVAASNTARAFYRVE